LPILPPPDLVTVNMKEDDLVTVKMKEDDFENN
jgi:hypothetical protein